jgi:pimeloyl-ACP methyl ester carboxylesterase
LPPRLAEGRAMKRAQFGSALGAAAVLSAAASAAAAKRAEAADRADAASAGPISTAEYWAHKGAVKLYVFRKSAAPPAAARRPVLFLVHGSSMSGRSTFDLTVPGHDDYSMMDAFARYGYDVWTMDHEGYGRSDRTSGNSDIASGVQDLRAAMEVVRRETGQRSAHFFGESSGGIRAAAFAVADRESVGRLALSAFTWTGKGSPTLANRAKDVEFYRTHNVRPATRELYRSIFTRDKPGTADPSVGDALYEAESKFGDSVPTGTYLDMVTKLPLVDPEKLNVPVLMARGEYDGISTEEDLLGFFERLANRDKQYAVLPGSAHSLVLGYNRARFWYTVDAFLRPPPRADRLG